MLAGKARSTDGVSLVTSITFNDFNSLATMLARRLEHRELADRARHFSIEHRSFLRYQS